MLFPNTKIEFKPLDKVKLLVTCGGGTAAGVMAPPPRSSPLPIRSRWLSGCSASAPWCSAR
jgi:hypothetical protein